MTLEPTLPPPATIAYIRRRRRLRGAHGLEQSGDRGLSRAHDAHAAIGVQLRAGRIEDADDDGGDVVALLQHLSDHDVRVVAARRDDRGLGVGDARTLEHGHVHSVPDDESSAPPLAETRKRILGLVDDADVPAVRGETLGHRRADPPAPDHDGVHGSPAYSSNTPSGNATTSTSHGAFRSTKSTVGEKKRDCLRQRGDEPRTTRSDRLALRLLDDRVPDRARTHDLAVHLDAVVRAERASLLQRRVDPRRHVRRKLALELEPPRHANDRDRVDRRAALLRERDRRRDHLLPDVAELHRHEDPLEIRGAGRVSAGATCSSSPRRRVRRTATKTARPRRSQTGPA